MAISLHCESCGSKIKAPDGTGGKYGRCPHCKHRNYIPLPKQPGEEELKLAPIDESEETKYAALMQETFHLTEKILDEKDPLEEVPQGGGVKVAGKPNEKDLLKNILMYLVQMAHGQLDAAARTIKKITPYKQETSEILNRMQKTSRPEPELAEIPPHVLEGLIDNLKKQL